MLNETVFQFHAFDFNQIIPYCIAIICWSNYYQPILGRRIPFADTGITLFEVVDNSQMHLDLNVYEKI